jgi:hypothetical protein
MNNPYIEMLLAQKKLTASSLECKGQARALDAQKLFKRADLDGSGSIDADEIKKLLLSEGVDVSVDQVGQVRAPPRRLIFCI